jgi:hypothetical protein
VKDTSGAVLPGVSVEASSPVLIEKTRSAVTGSSGQYEIVDLRPGTYTVTFMLSGFSVVKREGVEVSGAGVITINADLRVGAIAETITVTGETPVVDTQSTRRQSVLSSEIINALPASRSYGAYLTAIPSMQVGLGGMSALTDPQMTFFTAYGGRPNEGRVTIDGMNVAASFNGGGVSTFTYDVANAEEMQVTISGAMGEAENGGPSINLVPRSGGNTFRGSVFYSGAGDWSQGSNVDDSLRALGIVAPPALINNWDVNGSFGGPIKRDKLWFFVNARNYTTIQVLESVVANRNAGDPTKWFYEADPSLAARSANSRDIYSFRVTAQPTPRNRVSFSHEYQHRCSGSSLTESGDSSCRPRASDWIALGNAGGAFGLGPSSPESWPGHHDFPYNVTQATWSSPVSTRLLLEAGFSRFQYLWAGFGTAPPDGLFDLIAVTEQSARYGRPNFNYRGIFDPLGFGFADNDANPNNWRTSASYVTGAHSMKVGYQGSYQRSLQRRRANNTLMRYTFNQGVPTFVSYTLTPVWEQNDRTMSHSIYLQDQWTRGRMTLQGAVRYDRASSWAPAEGNGTTTTSIFAPNPITFPRTVSVAGYNDITPRVGVAYDLLGNGKTAIKANVGKYLQSATNDENYWANNPAGRIVRNIGVGGPARAWNDADKDFVVDCDLTSLNANGECGGLGGNSRNFGSPNPASTIVNPEILKGWGVRPYDWQFGLSVQQEVIPRVSVEVGYHRRSFGNFFVTDNQLTTAADYEKWTLTVPQHPQLPGGGTTRTYYAITQAASNRGAQNYQTFETDFGEARTTYWHGVDFTLNGRLQNGVIFQGGTATGRGVRDTCSVVSALPELLVVLGTNQQFESCHVTEKWLTSFRGLASYTLPRVDVLVSATMRSLPGTTLGAGGDPATNALSLAANYNVPNTVVRDSLGRLPANALPNGNTTVNLLTPGVLFGPDRINQVDMRFAKILRFGRTRADIGIDLYNMFNTHDITAYVQTYDYATNGATWLNPSTIVQPRFVRFNVRLDF